MHLSLVRKDTDFIRIFARKEENVVYLAGLEHVSSHRMLFGTKYAMIKVVDGMEFVHSQSEET